MGEKEGAPGALAALGKWCLSLKGATATFVTATALTAGVAWQAGGPREEIVNSVGMPLRLIPGGTFLMGSQPDETGREDDEPLPHLVTVEPFYMGVYEVRAVDYRPFVEETGPEHRPEMWPSHFDPNDSRRMIYPNVAVADLTWRDAAAHCEWLSEREGVTHSLPTEAQWECACRAGATTAWSFGDIFDPALALVGIQGEMPPGHTGDVGFFPPNAFGLYDMHGNVAEMCSDPFMAAHRADDEQRTDESWALRGGSWHTPIDHSRAGARCSFFDGERAYDVGFRVVRAVE
ncbi:formylglycine-generating enzyme family protein [Candidatus Sumerlaeota bacterium]|nr:formylglycine-generating enzyme family protein [Candidatus Sumerlaeota bacterium]